MLESNAASQSRLAPLLKWAGGKEQELKYILPLLPVFQRYYEPFVGGGAVFFSVQAREKLINDRSSELVQFYTMVARQDAQLLQTLDLLAHGWRELSSFADAHAAELVAIYTAYGRAQHSCSNLERQLQALLDTHQHTLCSLLPPFDWQNGKNFLAELRSNLVSKTRRMRRLELQKWLLPEADIFSNLECALKSAFYMHLRYLYNHLEVSQIPPGAASAIFFFVRENAYASMFRYNSQGKFNVPYGGISYNRKDLARKIIPLRSADLRAHLRETVIENLDFEAFLTRYPPREGDFLFLDPPYDSDFSTYMRNEFGQDDQKRLADYLLRRCPAKFLLVIKNTPFIQDLYGQTGLHIKSFQKRYLVSFQDRNNRAAEHLLITNYPA